MAELLLHVGDNPDPKSYKDGDILCAFNQRRIRCVHAQHICHINLTAFNGDGLNVDGIAKKYLEATSSVKIVRLNKTQAKRIDLLTMEEEIIPPNQMDVDLYFARRVQHPKHKVFGTKGKEIIYGGRTNVSNAVMNIVWNMIETDTPKREKDHTKWPLTSIEKRVFLGLGIDDFTEQESSDFIESEIEVIDDSTSITHKKRRRYVDWKSLGLSRSQADVENKGKSIDVRNSNSLRKRNHINVKALN